MEFTFSIFYDGYLSWHRSQWLYLISCLSYDVDYVCSSGNLCKMLFYSVINYMLLLDRASYAGDLQSISWTAMAFGGICGSLLGGFALSSLQIDYIFLLFSVLPCIQLISCCFVNEDSVNRKGLVEDSIARDSHTNGDSSSSSTLDEDSPLAKKSHSSTRKRKKGKKNTKNRAANTSKTKVLEKGDSLASKWYHSLKNASYDLCRAFRQPMILR